VKSVDVTLESDWGYLPGTDFSQRRTQMVYGGAKDDVGCEVESPVHYDLFPDTEVIDVIRKQLTSSEFIGYCKGNILKYRLRAGKKGDADRDVSKAEIYDNWLREEVV